MRPAEYTAFAAALHEPLAPVPDGLLSAGTASVDERFAVYRNNVHASLVEALGERHPIARKLVGEEFFRAMARVYVQRQKPTAAGLWRYGEGMAAFIEAFPPAAALPWLADVAALENAWLESWAAADAPAITLAQLAGSTPQSLCAASFRVHPATRLLRSEWPIAGIWQAHQDSDPDLSDLRWVAEAVLITRPEEKIMLQRLPDGAASLAEALMAGETLASAAACALARDPGLDVGQALRALLEAGFASEVLRS